MLSVQNVSKRFGGLLAVADASVVVERSAITGVGALRWSE